MKICRPKEEMPISLSTTQMIFYSFCVRAARRFRWLPMQRFFRRCPYIFTEGFKIRLLHGASQMKPSFDFDGIDLREILGSGVLAREMADIAADRGYREEGSALYITSARLIHKAYSNIQALFEAGITPAAPTKEQIEGLLLFAFEGIGRIEVLPQDDLSFWQNRSAEVIAALFYGVIRFPFNDAERMRVRRSFSAAAGAASLISLAVSEEIIPMGVGSRYIGGPLAFLDCSRT